ncbi:uncharacterized protein SPPG_03513 [Spizellomyces punctatus DAOM BR117]|uniref:Hepatocellular carcinoma-associated antigen 59 domain-containing protein n=1 Tax=Spizellomyces punctatus (strain DAOM BR117) TaxID=645134 RepID=A0A0L0HLE7_SPIPD|nr:uncharacterized protein SPPG_03513 [Spizellomyces punctatus DAOM BR117]KND01720.1 hypothetical protein SPPG_03513 [Spizellomyces punctatus DAOM BR117]|eukprot:XP_016609759.1 hypothetical protein SPPG_03513 [Spizellomyces punctatus DAOM BR117]
MVPPKKRQYRKRSVDQDPSNPPQEDPDPTELEEKAEDVSAVVQEALELRRFRRRAAGLDTADLSRGDKRKKKEKPVNDDPWKLKTGGGIINIDDVRGRNFGEDGRGGGGGGSFATASNVMDTDRHMREYIEQELRKRRGASSSEAGGAERTGENGAPKDIQDELFEVPEHLKTVEKPVSEGNVTLSTSMLTAIPEIDLGINTKLKNIEATERAKRQLIERTADIASERSKSDSPIPGNEFAGANMVASDRWQRFPYRRDDRDQEAKTAAQGNMERSGGTRKGDAEKKLDRRTMATDEVVMERFKKRMRRG